jgi:hypothetical protein
MLKLIHCEQFRSTPVKLSPGFNVVAGDNVATNSIGKSTFLMIVDFAMGGNTFLEHNSDVVDELGHHSYNFVFEFKNADFFFRRDTKNPETVFLCDDKWEIQKAITTEDYRELLSQHYHVTGLGLTFRGLVSLFSRIWGKENLDTDRPLDAHPKQRANEAITLVLKLFEKYETLAELDTELKRVKAEKDALKDAFKENIVPKILKKQYRANEELASQAGNELQDIKANLARYATNIREITNREVAEVKTEKDSLLKAKAVIDGRLRRVRASLSESKHVKSKLFESLKEFFPDVADDRIALVEEFHSDIAKILKREIRASEKELTGESERIGASLSDLDGRLSVLLKNVENPGIIVDRVFELSIRKGNAERENEYYDRSETLAESVKELRTNFEDAKRNQLALIAASINDALRELSEELYGSGRKCPYLSFTNTNYKYQIFEDTGTGKAFSNLILFDWAVFELTSVPFLIHDSLLFKNIENEAVARMIKIYSELNRQTFIAIDEIQKYGEEAKGIVEDHTRLSLSDSAVLYVKDWRK